MLMLSDWILHRMAGAGEIAILAAVLVGLVVTYLLQKRNLLSRPANAKEPPLKVEAVSLLPDDPRDTNESKKQQSNTSTSHDVYT